MKRIVLVLCALVVCLGIPTKVEARQAARGSAYHPMCNITMPCDIPSVSPRRVTRLARAPRAQRSVVVEHRARRYVTVAARRTQDVPAITDVASTIGAPSRFVAGRLICAVNVGVALAERGIKGTGSALAMSYLKWGRSAGGPVPGAVIVSPRRGGGHVAIVSRVVNGVVYAWNATGGQRGWREIPYHHHVIDYRVPG